MSTEIQTAMKCFDENIRLFADANTQPEKYNLYNGLFNLAKSIELLSLELNAIKRKMDSR